MSRRDIFEVVRSARGGKPWLSPDIALMDEVLDRLGVPHDGGSARAIRDAEAFYGALRGSGLFPGGLKDGQVKGLQAIIGACGDAGWPLPYTAYGLATAYWETAKTLQPVAEAYWIKNAEAWRKANLRYYPHYGRGYVQLTWPKNYERADRELGLGGKLVANLDLAMDQHIAAKIMVRGMAGGWFTGKKLSDTLPLTVPATFEQFKKSRPIINGTDKDDEIAEIAVHFQAALQAGRYA